MKNFIKSGAIGVIFFFSALSTAMDPIPSAVSEAAQAVVKVTAYSPKGKSVHGTGFAVTNKTGQVFVVTNFDLIHSHSLDTTHMQLRENSVEVEALSGQILKIKGLTDFSLFSNSVLIEVTGYKGPALKLSHFNEAEDKVAYLMEFPWDTPDQLKQMKIVGLVPAGQTTLSGFSYSTVNREGNGGGPLFNRNGAVIGAAQNRRFDYMPYFTKSGFLKALLEKTERQQSEFDLMDQFKKEMDSLTAFSTAGDSEAHFRLINIRMNAQNNPEEIPSDPEIIDIGNWKRKAIRTGDMRSIYAIGFIFQTRISVTKSWPIFKFAARNGHPGAMYQIGLNYLLEKEDEEQANFWLKKAAEKGCPDAKFLLAWEFYNHDDPDKTTEDSKKSLPFLTELVEEEFPTALNFLKNTNTGSCHTSLRKP